MWRLDEARRVLTRRLLVPMPIPLPCPRWRGTPNLAGEARVSSSLGVTEPPGSGDAPTVPGLGDRRVTSDDMGAGLLRLGDELDATPDASFLALAAAEAAGLRLPRRRLLDTAKFSM